jgi:hypothetical protein
MVLCPNRHENSDTVSVCGSCGLPLVAVEREFARIVAALSSRSVLARPKAHTFLAGIGPVGSAAVKVLVPKLGENIPRLACLTLNAVGVGEGQSGSSVPVFSLSIGRDVPGAALFCGRMESLAEGDYSIGPLVRNAGLREEDENQAVMTVLALGEGEASGIAPVFLRHARSGNPGCSSFVLAVLPAIDDSVHAHINAYYGLSRILSPGGTSLVDGVIIMQRDRLKKVRGVGQTGEELGAEGLIEGLFGLMGNTLGAPHGARFAALNRWMHTPVLVPCLALGRSLEIFGSMRNVLESSIAYPLSPITEDDVTVAELLLRIPERLARSFPEDVLAEDLAAFNRRHFPGIKSALFQVSYSDQRHDRIDVCILLGGGRASAILGETKTAFERSRREGFSQGQWDAFGLTAEKIANAERIIAGF